MSHTTLIVGLMSSFLLMGCGPPKAPPGPQRIPLVPEDHPLYERLEAPFASNACTSDADCLPSGCSGEVCAAEPLVTTCEIPVGGWPTQGASCGCVAARCRWYTLDGRTLGSGR